MTSEVAKEREGPTRRRGIARAFDYATQGVVHVFRTERHMRFHVWVALLLSVGGALLRLPMLELLFTWSAILLVLLTEMFNTALEDLADLITTEWDIRAGRVKDIGAGMVLMSVVYAVGVFVIVFLRSERIDEVWNALQALGYGVTGRPELARTAIASSMVVRSMPLVELGATGLVMLALLIIILKQRIAKGSFVSGGWVSGHAAVSFFVAMLLALASLNVWVFAGTMVLAALVCQSRIEGGIHSFREVARGAVCGIVLATALYITGALSVGVS